MAGEVAESTGIMDAGMVLIRIPFRPLFCARSPSMQLCMREALCLYIHVTYLSVGVWGDVRDGAPGVEGIRQLCALNNKRCTHLLRYCRPR